MKVFHLKFHETTSFAMKYKKDAAGERAEFLKTCHSGTSCHMFDLTFDILLISFTKVSLLVMFVSFLY